jgi:hypothetical protein
MRYALIRSSHGAYFCPEEVHFVNDELLHTVDRVLVFKGEIEFLKVDKQTELGRRWRQSTMTHGWADGLVRRVMPDSQVRVLQRLVAGDALRRVKVKHLGEQIERERVRVREHLRERHPWPDGQRTDVVLCLRVQGLAAAHKGIVSGFIRRPPDPG